MPDVTIRIGGREFEVACAEGEEHYLKAAAKMLDDEAQALIAQVGRIPEARMLLMAGLMLADKAAGIQDRLREVEDRLGEVMAELKALEDRPPAPPERIEVPVIPTEVTERLAELAARAEALAGRLEDDVARAASGGEGTGSG